MKSFVLLPLTLLAVSCFPAEPYAQQPPPYRDGEPFYPYGPGGRAPGTETGQFEPVPDGNRPPPPVAPPGTPRPPSPRINPDVDAPDAYDAPSTPAPAPAPRPTYPDARRTANPNQVISPYAPYNVIDVEGFRSGALAKDPSNGKIFRVP
ncbi:hypothetical protein OKA05_13620 [Luteolibacter arcticus]|uniref:Uncharacterized protein n=1 Tax=Luteolibacter arcticus TaxID=1581411 RepID=A0ABT3GJ97_9BACT|nr:hypothetical protein [Luteolibacter arcticus]MCW1923598.1 hypothetical protein [Luteolibacter arcticus]